MIKMKPDNYIEDSGIATSADANSFELDEPGTPPPPIIGPFRYNKHLMKFYKQVN